MYTFKYVCMYVCMYVSLARLLPLSFCIYIYITKQPGLRLVIREEARRRNHATRGKSLTLNPVTLNPACNVMYVCM